MDTKSFSKEFYFWDMRSISQNLNIGGHSIKDRKKKMYIFIL
jgi:hypothetical protein